MSNMILHCGARAVDRRQVELIETPEPSGRWMPVSHALAIEKWETVLESTGLTIVSETHALAPGRGGLPGGRYFGMWELTNGNGNSGSKLAHRIVAGLRNSHDKEFALGGLLGSRLTICDNLIFSSDEVKISRIHTKNILKDLDRLMATAMGSLMALRGLTSNRLERYTEVPCEYGPDASHLIIRSVQAGVISPSQVGKVLKSWQEPEHGEWAEDWSLNRLYQAYSENWRGNNVFDIPRRSNALHGLFDPFAGFDAGGCIKKAREDLQEQGVIDAEFQVVGQND